MVQDPNFWRRFSVAVHQDDVSKEEAASRPDLKHSYVYPSTSTCTSAPLSPTSQSHLSPAFPGSPVTSMSILSGSMNVSTPALATLRREEVWQAEIEAEKAAEREREREGDERVQLQPTATVRRASKLKKSASRASTRPLLRRTTLTQTSTSLSPDLENPLQPPTPFSQRRPSFPRRPSIPGFRSPSALSLSGRPRSAFKTWTTITANPHPRDSWLQGQQRKKRQRTWICWCFWLCVLALVAGVVVAVVVLKKYGVI